MVQLEPMTGEEFRAFIDWLDRDYASAHVRAGTWDASEALARAHAETGKLLPKGLETPDHFLRVIRADPSGDRVGEVWYCYQRGERRPALFVYWIGIDAKHRRRGFAAATLEALEREGRNAGCARIALHVFGDNAAAQSLYAKLGYRPTNVLMAKPLAT
jgi:ribosomal protein S18 acetylase RimI-like enzyme